MEEVTHKVTGLSISNSYNLLFLPSNPGMPQEFFDPYAHFAVLLKDTTLIN